MPDLLGAEGAAGAGRADGDWNELRLPLIDWTIRCPDGQRWRRCRCPDPPMPRWQTPMPRWPD